MAQANKKSRRLQQKNLAAPPAVRHLPGTFGTSQVAICDLFDVDEAASLSCATQADCAALILQSRVSVPRYLDQREIVRNDRFHVPTINIA